MGYDGFLGLIDWILEKELFLEVWIGVRIGLYVGRSNGKLKG